MGKGTLKMDLLELPNHALSILYPAGRQCHSSKGAAQIFQEALHKIPRQEEFIRDLVASGHEGPLEHVRLTFAIEGVLGF